MKRVTQFVSFRLGIIAGLVCVLLSPLKAQTVTDFAVNVDRSPFIVLPLAPTLHPVGTDPSQPTEAVDPAETATQASTTGGLPAPAAGGALGQLKSWDGWLTARGIEPHLSVKTEMSGSLIGDGGKYQVDARNLLEVSVGVDLDKVAGWKGAKLYSSVHSFAGSDGSAEITGDCQGYSNINSPEGTHLFELWLEQNLWSGKLRFKLGKMDANTDFAYVENASGFLNGSMGHSPTIADMPTYPLARLGGAIFFKPTRFTYLSEGVFKDENGGVMSFSEGGVRWRLASAELAGRVAVGYWKHSQPISALETWIGNLPAGSGGYYVVAEQMFLKQHGDSGSGPRGIGAYFQFGTADPWSNEMDQHIGMGGQWQGPFAGRPADLAGLGASLVHLGPSVGQSGSANERHERTIESFYRYQLKAWLSLTADGQYIDHPHGDPLRPHAMVGSLRMTITL